MTDVFEVDGAVVGAGMSGLTAARLDEAGADVCRLEAADRVGGHLLNDEVAPGVFLGVGGRFVGTTREPTLGRVEEMGSEVFEAYRLGRGRGLASRRRAYRPRRSAINVPGATGELRPRGRRSGRPRRLRRPEGALERARRRGARSPHVRVSVGGARARRARAPGVPRYGRDRVRDPPSLVSLLHAATTWAALGGLDSVRLADEIRILGGGYGICGNMAAEVGGRVHLSAPARRVGWGPSGATVHAERMTIVGRQCIVAISPATAHWSTSIRDFPGIVTTSTATACRCRCDDGSRL